MITLQEYNATGYPNHTYIVSDDKSKLLAYIPLSSGEKVEFSKPLPFSTRGRTFRLVKEEAVVGRVVVGSKGDRYYVTDGKCTCPGFKFRGSCRHVAE